MKSIKCFDTSRMNLFKKSEIKCVLKWSQILPFLHDLGKKCILRSLIFPWTKSLKITCFSEQGEPMESQAVRTLCVDALTPLY